MNQTFTIDLNRLCRCGNNHVISGTEYCPHCTPIDPHPEEPVTAAVQPRTGRGLAGSLLDLIVRAEKLADRQFHALLLPRGLIIEIGIGNEFNLRLARRDSYPSAAEWQTVVSALPLAYKPEAAVLPRDFKHTARDGSTKWYLDAHWAMKRK
jgi:hypothetical protein